MESRTNQRDAAHITILVLASVAVGIGLLTLLGWILALPLLTSSGTNLMPMAPSTALLFVLFGVALFFRTLLPQRRGTYVLGLVIGSIGAVTALLLLIVSSVGIHPQIEHLGLSPAGTVDGAPIGHMSPLTAICFVVIALSLLAALSSSAERPRRARVAFWLACLIIMISLILLLAYLLGTPLLYGGDIIPPALSTSLAFLVLALALLVTAVLNIWPYHKMKDATTPRVSYVFVLVFVLLTSGIVATGYFYYRNYEKQYRKEIEHQLSAIADLKVGELVQWRKERLGDAAVFYRNANFSIRFGQYLAMPKSVDAQTKLLTYVRQVREAYQYDRLCLYDAEMVERLSYPNGIEPTDSILLRCASEVLRSQQIAFQDFYRDEHDGHVYLNILIPILGTQKSDRVMGILAMRIDPEKYLYPLLKRWLTPSRTAETLLIRREGTDALFLNELKFRKNTTLNLRSPLTDERMVAVKAALGEEGIVEGVDYRSVPVIADVRAIPNSPWFLVARMDLDEVYEPLRERLWMTIFLIASLLASAGTGVGLVWRQQRMKFYEERLESAERTRKLNRVYAVLSDINQAIVRVREPQALFERACHIAVEQGNFPLAWVGLVDDSTQGLQVAACAGKSDGYLEKINISLNNVPLGYCPIDAALRKGELVVCNMIGQDEPIAPCQKAALELGLRSSMSFPLRVSGRIRGTFSLYADEPDFFDEEERKLLGELAMDISFAMEFSEKEAERKLTEEALHESEARLHMLIEGVTDYAIYLLDTGGMVVNWNAGAERLKGYRSDEIIGQHFSRFFGLEDQQNGKPQRLLAEARLRGRVEDEGWRVRRDGSRFWANAVITALLKEDGSLYAYAKVTRDLTEQKQGEEAVRQTSEALGTMVETSPLAIIVTDPQGLVTLWNRAAETTFCWTAAEVIGKPNPIIPSDKRDEVRHVRQQIIEGGSLIESETERVRKDGVRIAVSFSATALRNTEGQPYGILAIVADITERKRAEEQIRKLNEELQTRVRQRTGELTESEERFRQLAEASYEGIIIHEGGVLLRANDQFFRLFGLESGDDLLGKQVMSMTTAPESLEVLKKQIDAGGLGPYEATGLRKDGTTFPMEIRARNMDYKGRPVRVAAIMDITRRKQAEDALRERTAALENANKELEAFSYSVSHDLRAPLRAIESFSRIVLEEYAQRLDAEGKRLLNIICANTKKMDELITDMLDLSRVSRNEINISRIDMTTLANSIYHEIASPELQKQFSFSVAPLPDAYGDASLVRQVWRNLISNAVKFTAPKDVRKIEIGGGLDKGTCTYFIKDSGVGFDPKYTHKLFGVFQRLHKAEDFEGTGVGLAIVQRIVHRHGGRVWAEGKVGEGAVFYFTIPSKIE